MPVIPYAQGAWTDVANANEERPSTEEYTQGVLANMAEGLSNSIFGGASYRAGERFGYDIRAQAAGESFVTSSDAAQQAKDAGVSISGVGENGISQGALNVMIDHQQHEAERAQLIQRSGQTGIMGFLERVAGDPMIAVPFGEGVGALEAAGTSLAARVGKAAISAGADTAAIEAMNYPIQNYSGDDYTMVDSLRNIALGTAMGGVFGAGAHVTENILARKSLRMGALAQIADDRPVSVGEFALEPGKMNAFSVGTGEDLANSLIAAPQEATSRDQELLDTFMNERPAHPNAQAELDRVNAHEPATLTEEDRLHPVNADQLSEAVQNEMNDAKGVLAHSPPALAEMDEKVAAAGANDNDFLGALKEGINCARANGAP